MRRGRPSSTASFVAVMRGLAEFERDSLVADPYAARLVGGPYRLGLSIAGRAPALTRWALGAASLLSRGKTRHLELRTKAIDDVIVADAPRPLVILGAGLDARAHRLEALGDAPVFEVDHPDTQRYKRARLAGAPTARTVRYVPVDFERDDLERSLVDAGFDRSAPASFLWEGVTMYLTEPAVRSTLAALARLAAPGSTLAVTYHEPRFRVEGALAHVWVRGVGEPFRLRLTPATLADWLRDVGFQVVSDESDEEWARRGLGRTIPSVGERLAVARRVLVDGERNAR